MYFSLAQVEVDWDKSNTKAAVLAFHKGLAQELKHRYNAPRVRTTYVQIITIHVVHITLAYFLS